MSQRFVFKAYTQNKSDRGVTFQTSSAKYFTITDTKENAEKAAKEWAERKNFVNLELLK